MASPLDGLKKAIANGFRGKLKFGTIRRNVPGTGVDEYGDPNPGLVDIFAFQGIREDFEAAWRVRAGIPETDCKFLLIAGLTGTVPLQGDQINITGEAGWYQVRKILDIDPADASYQLQCYDIKDPTSL